MNRDDIARVSDKAFASQFEFVHRVREAAAELFRNIEPNAAEPDAWLTALMLARTSVSLEAAVDLFRRGYEYEARGLGRSITEYAIDLHWILKEDAVQRATQYFEFAHAQTKRWIDKLPTILPDQDVGDRFALIERLHPGFARVRADVAADAERVKKTHGFKSSWTQLKISQRAQATGLTWLYEVAYAAGSDASHSNAGGVLDVLRTATEIETSASVPGNLLAVVLACVSFLTLMERAWQRLRHEPMPDAYGKDFIEVFASFLPFPPPIVDRPT